MGFEDFLRFIKPTVSADWFPFQSAEVPNRQPIAGGGAVGDFLAEAGHGSPRALQCLRLGRASRMPSSSGSGTGESFFFVLSSFLCVFFVVF